MMAGTLRVRRRRGALSGALLVLLGIWGALIPFVGPYFHYAYTPDRAWTATSGRMWLEVLPGVVTLVGGLVVLVSRFRPAVVFGAWLAALAGAWFAVGGVVAVHWAGLKSAGAPVGGPARSALEQLGFFAGLGVVIVFMAALALGRFTVVAVSDAAAATADARAAKADGRAAKADARAATADAGAAQAGLGAAQAGAAPPARVRGQIRPVAVVRGRSRSGAAAAATGDADAAQAKADDAAAEAGAARGN